jgi:hypothetical protein
MAAAVVDFTVSRVPTRGWVPAKRRSSGGPWTKQTERVRERSSDGSCIYIYIHTHTNFGPMGHIHFLDKSNCCDGQGILE